ncbi:hypothetical protein V8E53_006376 [Lactarius tabidus]
MPQQLVPYYLSATCPICQNPLTKEPKLAQARQIQEWELYDGEIARFTQRLADEGGVLAGTAAADVNELAKAESVPVPALEDSEGEEEGRVSAHNMRVSTI